MPFPFELAVDPGLLSILALVAFVAGFIDAIAGGGGLLTIPALLTAGLPPHLVLGTNKLCATFGAATASYTFYRRQLFNPALWRNGLLRTEREPFLLMAACDHRSVIGNVLWSAKECGRNVLAELDGS